MVLTSDVEHKADKAVVGSKREEDLVDEDNVLEVVNDALSVQEVHCRTQEIPVQALRKPQAPGAARYVGNGDDLLEGNYLG